MKMTAIGDLLEVSTSKLTVIVQNNPISYIRCRRKVHNYDGAECQFPGIRPKSMASCNVSADSPALPEDQRLGPP